MSRYRPGVPKRGIYRSSSKSSASSFIGGLFKVGASMASAYQKKPNGKNVNKPEVLLRTIGS